ncbi:hypothetical protein SY83_01095 [Paenibacillus swuensis]|uniref:DUF3298 domain-containing protein n=1 Tax=Paenibacillus swuensis TaxID=1178515 RepID=A0A172TDZ0_9BACL|nr:DUF3298 and DUF4163 domain-containing protein [Paenibacillus swuensis]ANE45162.1 hypothetical protein SY83_01095 [Paenibacillus swuensis]
MTNYAYPVGIQSKSMPTPGGSFNYPAITGLNNTAIQDKMNREIVQLMQVMMKSQQDYLKGTDPESIGNYEIKTNERGILSLVLSSYVFSSPMAHGNTIARSLTFDVKTGKSYQLAELFKPGSDYVKTLSALVAAQIKSRDIQTLEPFMAISPDQNFYLADKALVLYFQLYEITPYYFGIPMFPISVYDLQSIAVENGLLDVLSQQLS